MYVHPECTDGVIIYKTLVSIKSVTLNEVKNLFRISEILLCMLLR
jgi:hypothetical protein